jgi:hypothetical protein
MFKRLFLSALIALAAGLPARATELKDIERTILREPAYESAPRYCLLVFGPDADTRVWLVQDGKTLHNGNGDLTEPGTRVQSVNTTHFTVSRINERSGTIHKNLRVHSAADGTFSLQIGEEGRREQYVGIGRMDKPRWGDRPANAPIIHFNGPMALERYGPVYTLPRMTGNEDHRRFKLRLMVGTPGLGHGTFASYDEICTEKLGPIQADIEYPSGDPCGKPIKQGTELIHDG